MYDQTTQILQASKYNESNDTDFKFKIEKYFHTYPKDNVYAILHIIINI